MAEVNWSELVFLLSNVFLAMGHIGLVCAHLLGQ
jgi:hypothetical protein